MPAFMIHGKYPNSIGSIIGGNFMGLLPTPLNMLFLMMLGMYILLRVLRTNIWQAIMTENL
jgi:hypothetical protein